MPRERLSMRQIKEVLRLKHQMGLTDRQIGRSCGLSHTTVAKYLKGAAPAGLGWPLPEEMDAAQLWGCLFGRTAPSLPPGRAPLPPMEVLHRELKRPGVTLQLLWQEYRAAMPMATATPSFAATPGTGRRPWRSPCGKATPPGRRPSSTGPGRPCGGPTWTPTRPNSLSPCWGPATTPTLKPFPPSNWPTGSMPTSTPSPSSVASPNC